MSDWFHVGRCLGVDLTDEVGEPNLGENVEGLGVRQNVHVTICDHDVLRRAYASYQCGHSFGLPAALRGVVLARGHPHAVKVGDRRTTPVPVCDANRVRQAATVLRWLRIVVGEGAMHERDLAADHRQVRGHESGDPKVLPTHHAVLALHGTGVAGGELRLVVRQYPAHIVEQAGTLPRGAIGVGVGDLSAIPRSLGDLLQAQHVGTAFW